MRKFDLDNCGRPHNPYYSPEKCGLRILEVTEEPGLCYEFDMVVLWQDKETGKRYWARDSGCSCPCPFENVHGLDNMNWDLSDYETATEECSRGE